MEVHDEHVPAEVYAEFVARMPQVCVEVVVETDDGVLLTKRTSEPARGEWFWPGSRLYKGEALDDAARRIAREELGLDVGVVERFGVYAHCWETSAEGPSRHTVNVVFRVRPRGSADVTLDDQHSDYRYVDAVEQDLHEHVCRYLRDAEFLD